MLKVPEVLSALWVCKSRTAALMFNETSRTVDLWFVDNFGTDKSQHSRPTAAKVLSSILKTAVRQIYM